MQSFAIKNKEISVGERNVMDFGFAIRKNARHQQGQKFWFARLKFVPSIYLQFFMLSYHSHYYSCVKDFCVCLKNTGKLMNPD